MPSPFRFEPSSELRLDSTKVKGKMVMLGNPFRIGLPNFGTDRHDPKIVRTFSEKKGKQVTGRAVYHLSRLTRLDRQGVEKVPGYTNDIELQFAMDYLTHAPKAAKTNDLTEVVNAIGKDSTGVNHFWTFAPYIHHELKKIVKTPVEALKILFKWVREGHANDCYAQEKPLPGLEFLRDGETYHLEDNKQISGEQEPYPTHRFAALLAREFAPALAKHYG